MLNPVNTLLGGLPRMAVLDFRGIHKEKGVSYWTDAKCTTMKHLAALAKLLKKRKYPHRLLFDTDS